MLCSEILPRFLCRGSENLRMLLPRDNDLLALVYDFLNGNLTLPIPIDILHPISLDTH